MRIESEKLINELIEMTRQHMNTVLGLKDLPVASLNWKSDPESWSVLECIEHLNKYGDFYIPEIKKRILETNTQSSPGFKSGLLGNYFAKSMLPKEKINKMKTFKSMNPLNSKLDKGTLDRFITQQKDILELLNQAREINLNKTKTSISISNFIKLRLGDTFRVVIYHNYRHMEQVKKVLSKANAA